MSSTTDEKTPLAETSYQHGVVEGETAVAAAAPHTKQGHKCCGGCCDMRRAVMIVNVINVCFVAISLSTVLTFDRVASTVANSNATTTMIDDDEAIAFFEEYDTLREEMMPGVIIFMSIKLGASICGILGACYFNFWLTGISALAYVVDFFTSAIMINIPGALYAGFFAYPHYFFMSEIRQGIMTKENYPNEKQSCCCV